MTHISKTEQPSHNNLLKCVFVFVLFCIISVVVVVVVPELFLSIDAAEAVSIAGTFCNT